MFHSGGDFSLAFALTFSALFTCSDDHIDTNTFGHPTGIPRRHPVICSTSGMGRMDRFSVDNIDPGKWYHNMCDEKDTSEQEGSKEKNSRECGHERRELLCSTGSSACHGYGSSRIASSSAFPVGHEWWFRIGQAAKICNIRDQVYHRRRYDTSAYQNTIQQNIAEYAR